MFRLFWCGCMLTACVTVPDEPVDTIDDTVDSPDPFETGVPRTGCDDPALAAALAELDAWTVVKSCSFAYLGAASDDLTTSITVVMDVPQGSKVVGDRFTMDLSGVISNGGLSVVQGSNLLGGACDDVGPPDPPVFTRTWQAALGAVELVVTQGSEAAGVTEGEAPFDAEVSVTGLVVIHDDMSCAVPDWTIVRHFGWFPG